MRRVLLVVAVLALLVGCGGSAADPEPGPKVTPPAGLEPAVEVGPAEGRLDLLAPAGYVPQQARQIPGCDVRVTIADDSDEVVRRFSGGRFDGALGTSDAMVRLLSEGAIAPINTELIANYEDIQDGLKDRPFNAVGGQAFALPVGRAAQLMVWRRNAVVGSLTGLGALLDPPQVAALAEQLVVPDDPNVIAVAALWVARQRPDLEITDPYELDRRQFRAVLRILRLQQPHVAEYWTDGQAVRSAFLDRRASVGLADQATVGELTELSETLGPIGSTRPREGSLGVSPGWMLAADAEHPNCMYRFMNRALEPAVNARVALDADIAPAAEGACDVIEAQQGDGSYCDLRRADDEGFYKKVLFRTYPSSDCGDDRGRVCQDWDDFVRAWARIKAG